MRPRASLIATLVGSGALVAACSNGAFLEATNPGAPSRIGHVYLMRGLAGEVFSLGLQSLARKLNERGIPATVHSLPETITLPGEIAQLYRSDPTSAPIVLLGHSSGGDAIISIAERLRSANIPVALAFGFDPTPLAGRIPGNVELFVNLFQKTNPIGGGEVKAAAGFKGRLINVDLREHTEIIHITLDKADAIHRVVTEQIAGVVAAARQRPMPPDTTRPAGRKPPVSAAPRVRPLAMRYVIPREAPVEIWDDAVRIGIKPGQTWETIAAEHNVPAWLLLQVNAAADGALPGATVLVPQQSLRAAPR
jgi:thioesterase domain-containing protein